MQTPLFYTGALDNSGATVILDEDTSRHIIQVLRMRSGMPLNLTDGLGKLMSAEIVKDHKKKCEVRIIGLKSVAPEPRKISIAISLLKNSNRFEWFLEKATEIGIHEIIPLICDRTEKQKFRSDRMQHVLISAMIQSQQVWLPVLQEPKKFSDLIFHPGNHKNENPPTAKFDQKFIAHCIEEEKRNLSDLVNPDLSSQIILIGPEGDFTKPEIDLALRNHFLPVTLGETRLRTETAGVVAATILKISS